MAAAPGHKFGQQLGKFLETVVLQNILKPELEAFTRGGRYYLDHHGSRPARPGRKVTWEDKFGNMHDLDFVIELEGTPKKIGKPIAFIEAAWRRYTKHSKNKAQEIQGAILPIVDRHHESAPFFGVVLAGEFTAPSLAQLKNNHFAVIHIDYDTVISAFKAVGIDIAFDESTSDRKYGAASKRLSRLSVTEKSKIRDAIRLRASPQITKFLKQLKATLDRVIIKVLVTPLFGRQHAYEDINPAIAFLKSTSFKVADGDLHSFDLMVEFSNGDSVSANFRENGRAIQFLDSLR